MESKLSNILNRAFFADKNADLIYNNSKASQTITYPIFTNIASVSKRMNIYIKPNEHIVFNPHEKENLNSLLAADENNIINEKFKKLMNNPLKSSDRISSLYKKILNGDTNSNVNKSDKLKTLSRLSFNLLTKNESNADNDTERNSIAYKKQKTKNLSLKPKEDLDIQNPLKTKEIEVGFIQEEKHLLNSVEKINRTLTLNDPNGMFISQEKENLISPSVKSQLNFKFNFINNENNQEKIFLNLKRCRDELLVKNLNNSLKLNSLNSLIFAKKNKENNQAISSSLNSSYLESPSNKSFLSNKSDEKLNEENLQANQFNKEILYCEESKKEKIIEQKFKEIKEIFKQSPKQIDWNKLLKLTNLSQKNYYIIKRCICYKYYSGEKVQLILLEMDANKENALFFKIDPIKSKYYLVTKKFSNRF